MKHHWQNKNVMLQLIFFTLFIIKLTQQEINLLLLGTTEKNDIEMAQITQR